MSSALNLFVLVAHFTLKVSFSLIHALFILSLGFLSQLRDESTFSCIGSSNFGFRSAQRDNELQFYMISRNPEFNEALTSVIS